MIRDWISYIPEIAEGEDSYLGEPHNIQVDLSCLQKIDELIFAPIPLTSEILEKNGWIQCKYETCKSLYEYKGLHLRHTMIKRSNGRWVANVDGIVEKFPDEYTHSFLRINVFYVHELQHALRLCKLDELADNFKV